MNEAGLINDDWAGDAALTRTQALLIEEIVKRATQLNIPDCDELGLELELLDDGEGNDVQDSFFARLLETSDTRFVISIRLIRDRVYFKRRIDACGGSGRKEIRNGKE